MPDPTLKEQVTQAIEGGAAPAAAEASEVVTSQPEVKQEVAPEPVAPVTETVSDVNKDKEIVSNLNIALKEEREGRKAAEKLAQEALRKTSEFEEKMKNVFAPAPETPPESTPPQYLTKEDLDRMWQEKEQERINETETSKKVAMINAEVQRMETTWNGEDGKPRYDDQETLSWQQNNNKLYLTPEEAFFQMKRNEIIDYEAKRVLSGKKATPDATQPSSMPGSHEPTPTTPKTPQELRNAIFEAVNQGDTE